MLRESEAMKQVRKIREKNYESTKGMGSEEYIQYINDKAYKALGKKQLFVTVSDKKIMG